MAKKPKNTSLPSNLINTLSEDEKALFSQAVSDVTPQHSQRIAPDKRQTSQQHAYPNRRTALDPPSPTIKSKPLLTDHNGDNPVRSDTVLHFAKSGVQTRQLKRLRLGQYPIDVSLDLHGMTTDTAREQVSHLLHTAHTQHQRCVQIIHGCSRASQTPILKNHVNHWLRQHPYVLAFHSCPPALGGSGAVIVLIKR